MNRTNYCNQVVIYSNLIKKMAKIKNYNLAILSLCFILISISSNAQTTVALFKTSQTTGCSPLTIQFTNASKNAGSYYWDFGNGNVSILTDPVNVYSVPGTYTVKLVAQSANGQKDSIISTNLITVAANAVSDFYAVNTSACLGGNVFSFVNTSLHSVSYVWDFGDGTTSTIQHPTHSYLSEGNFTVKLISYNSCGGSDLKIITNYIHVFPKPLTSFTVNAISACAPNQVFSFNSTSTSVNSWLWNFGDGTISTIQSPQHTYTSSGIYTVSLITGNTSGCYDTLIKNNLITVSPAQIPTFTASTQSGCTEIPIKFTNTSINSIGWLWNFGESGTSTLENSSYTYKNKGNYTISLTITTKNNCTYKTTVNNYISIQDNSVSNFSVANSTGCAPLNVQFTNLSTNDFSRIWEFGDGTSSTLKNPSHIYTTKGVYTVKLRSKNAAGCESVYELKNAVNLTSPTAAFTANYSPGCAPLITNFTNTSINATQWLWNFGDGTTSTLKTPSHTYSLPGDYNVSLIVSDSKGCSDTLILNSYIHVINPIASYTPPPTVTGCVPYSTKLENTTPAAVSWLWNFGDGTSSTVQNPSHTFTQSGLFTVSLIIQLNGGCTQVYPNFRTFNVQGGQADFSIDQTKCSPYVVNFTDTTKNWVSVFWDFGDGKTSTLQNPSHTYTLPGFYSIKYTVTSSAGCKSMVYESNLIHFTDCVTHTGDTVKGGGVKIGGPDTTIINPNKIIPLRFCTPFMVHFHNKLSGTTSWLWDFGDGNTSNLENPFHTYISDGDFNVTMTGTDAAGKSNKIVYSNYIHTSGIDANFSFVKNSTCTNTTLTLTDLSQNAVQWLWKFGDGSTSQLQNPVNTYADSIANYIVTLTTYNSQGCSSSLTTNITNDKPVLWASKYVICGNQPVNFNCPASYSSYEWNFGDGSTTSTIQTPVHTYLVAGTYSVVLTATDKNGCKHKLLLQNPIQVQYPVADFVFAPASGCNFQTINFTNTSTGTLLPLSSHCKWNFGDGSSVASVENPTHQYATSGSGTFQVTLTINADNVCVQNITKTVIIAKTVADFSQTQNTLCFPLTVTYKDLSTKAISWLWDFGDGTTSTVQNPTHTFTSPPANGVKLTTTDASGCQSTKIKSNFSVFNTKFSVSAKDGCAPMNVIFSDSSLSATSWLWNFGDGTSSTLQNPVHNYFTSGTYVVKLISKTATGCTDTMIFSSIHVNKPTANFLAANPTGCSPTLVQFKDLSTGATSWLWDFGDGSSSVTQHPVHIYNIPGLYSIKLIVTNSSGCNDTLLRINYVKVPGAIANFSTSANQYCAQISVHFIDSSINAASWNWNFGDGNTSSQKNPSNNYTKPGQYTVSLIVHDSFGCTSNFTLPNPININPLPSSNFTILDSILCSPSSVSFKNYSKNAVSYLWNFGDGSSSTLPDPSHIYFKPGTNVVSLIATNGFGCSDTSLSHSLILNTKPVADFTSDVKAGCAPLNVSFIASASIVSKATYFWDFGNGTTVTTQNPTAVFTNPGKYTITLIVTNNTGCRDTLIKPSFIEVYDFSPPVETNILCVTVTSDTSTFLLWDQSTAKDFAYYKIYRKEIATGKFLPVGLINTISKTSFSDTLLNTLSNSYCYKVQTFDKCGYALPLDSLEEHCTMDVTAKGIKDRIKVSWTPYKGASVGTYSVYRMEIGKPASVLVATVPSTVLSIVDSNVCVSLDFSYRIKANNLNGSLIYSHSDTSISNAPYNILAQQQVHVVRSTVINNKEVLTEWDTPVIAPQKITGYDIYRSTDNINFTFLTNVTSLVHDYIDADVDVNAQNYYYKIEAKNACNVRTLPGNKSSSILLKAELKDGNVQLNWTKYEGWDMGVDYYIIEKMNEQGEWKVIKTVDGNQLIYELK